jgi:hypothetical protein
MSVFLRYDLQVCVVDDDRGGTETSVSGDGDHEILRILEFSPR